MPLLKACPEDPRIVNAVMLVPNSENRKTAVPRPAKRKDADVEHNCEVGENKKGGYQRPSSSGRRADAGVSKSEGQANFTSNTMTAEHKRQKPA